MRQLTYIKKEVLEWWEVAEPKLSSSKAAIVRPFIVGRCDADKIFLFNNYTTAIRTGLAIHYLDPVVTDLLGSHPYKGPIAVGHECVAEVVEIGDEVADFAVGDKVIVPWAISCGSCLMCQVGRPSHCDEAGDTLLSAYGFGSSTGPWGGAMSDKVLVPFADAMLVSVPENIDPLSLASASDNIPDAWRTVGPYLEKYPEAPVLVAAKGAESIGLYAVAIAKAMASSRVTYLDSDTQRLSTAEALGAEVIPIPQGKENAWYKKHAPRIRGIYPISVDTSACAGGLQFAIRSLDRGGVCTSVGFYFQKGTPIPLMQMYANDVTLKTGVSHPRADLPAVLSLIKSGKFQPEKITSQVARWDDAAEAYLERTQKLVIQRDPLYD